MLSRSTNEKLKPNGKPYSEEYKYTSALNRIICIGIKSSNESNSGRESINSSIDRANTEITRYLDENLLFTKK